MRSLKSGLIAIALTGIFGTVAVIGCSADGAGTGIETETDPVEPTPGSGSVVPPRGNEPEPPPVTDAGSKKDASPKPEAGVDAGPPPPVEGTTCTTPDKIVKKKCGVCGEAETVCLDDGTGAKWSPYGQCTKELPNGCTPGTTQPCGNCGTQTCTQFCGWGACTGQPANSCAVGTVDYTTAGCSVPSTYRNRTCGATCTYGSFGACEEPIHANKMTISNTAGAVVSAQWTLSAAKVGKKPSSCGGSVSSAATYPYEVVEVKNAGAASATVQLYHSGSGVPLDTVMWAYNKTLPPTDLTLAACDFGVGDSCVTGDPCGNAANAGSTYDWAGIDNVVIPAGGKILVYSAGYSAGEVGNFTLNIKTK